MLQQGLILENSLFLKAMISFLCSHAKNKIMFPGNKMWQRQTNLSQCPGYFACSFLKHHTAKQHMWTDSENAFSSVFCLAFLFPTSSLRLLLLNRTEPWSVTLIENLYTIISSHCAIFSDRMRAHGNVMSSALAGAAGPAGNLLSTQSISCSVSVYSVAFTLLLLWGQKLRNFFWVLFVKAFYDLNLHF